MSSAVRLACSSCTCYGASGTPNAASIKPAASGGAICFHFSLHNSSFILTAQRSAVRCIGFHEKVFKSKLVCFVVRAIGIVLPYGLGFGPGLDPKLAIISLENGTLLSGYRSLNTSRDASQSFQIGGPQFFSVVAGEGLIGGFVLPQS
jgi:hypothetical protein